MSLKFNVILSQCGVGHSWNMILIDYFFELYQSGEMNDLNVCHLQYYPKWAEVRGRRGMGRRRRGRVNTGTWGGAIVGLTGATRQLPVSPHIHPTSCYDLVSMRKTYTSSVPLYEGRYKQTNTLHIFSSSIQMTCYPLKTKYSSKGLNLL